MTNAVALRARILRRRFRRSFRRGVEDPKAPLSLDMRSSSRTLLIAFGGLAGALDGPPFEFFSLTDGVPAKRLFVRDLEQAWYHRGIPGGGSTIDEMADHLKQLLAKHEIDNLVVTGASAGGYAALVFGTLLGADTALCFAPQTVLDLDVLAGMEDHRWDRQLEDVVATGSLDAGWTDLRRALPGARVRDTRYRLYFDPTCLPDRMHCERVADMEGVELRPREGGGHHITRSMRDAGELKPLLLAALGVQDDDAPRRGSRPS